MKQKILVISIGMLIISACVLGGCGMPGETNFQVADDEIALEIKLDVKEDIGLLIVDCKTKESDISGGVSNADKSMLKRDDTLIYTLNKENFEDPSGVEDMSIQFTVITEYVDPNYENIYPKEYTKPMEEIKLRADFGNTYLITISGDKDGGYEAVYEGERSGESIDDDAR